MLGKVGMSHRNSTRERGEIYLGLHSCRVHVKVRGKYILLSVPLV